jgi:hypothetical protein
MSVGTRAIHAEYLGDRSRALSRTGRNHKILKRLWNGVKGGEKEPL